MLHVQTFSWPDAGLLFIPSHQHPQILCSDRMNMELNFLMQKTIVYSLVQARATVRVSCQFHRGHSSDITHSLEIYTDVFTLKRAVTWLEHCNRSRFDLNCRIKKHAPAVISMTIYTTDNPRNLHRKCFRISNLFNTVTNIGEKLK